MVKPAHIIFVSNPYEPLKDSQTFTVNYGKKWRKQCPTIREWLKKNKISKFVRPTICLHNGEPIVRRQWGRKIRPGDTINFVTCVGTGIEILFYIFAAVAVASVVIALSVKIPTNLTSDTPAADPVYTLKGQRNQIRLGQPIEVQYGKCRNFPSYAAQGYNQYINNQQWAFRLYSLGQGVFTVHDISIEDTPIADFSDVEWEVIPPGDPVTLFPTNVVTVAEVAGIELLGPNEGAGGAYVIDSEGDPTADPPIPETGHYNAALSGPFVVNATLTQTNRIEVDVQLPRGLYTQANDGTLNNLLLTALFELQEIDNAGAPVGAWFTPANFNWSYMRNTITPQRVTLSADVTLARYRIRASRTSNKDTSAKAGNTLIWESVRAFIPEDTVDDGITRLAVKARASNNLNDNSANRVNVVATRHVEVYDGTDWTLGPTRSPVWAFCDAFRAEYGARLADTYLDLDALVALDLTLADREEYFDWIFEQKTTVWDIARAIAAVARAVPMLNGSRITMIRDDVKTFPVAVFNQENIVKDSFKWEIKLAELNQYDGLIIVYTNPDTWKEETVLCCLADEDGLNPEQRKFIGITSRDHAYHLGMYLRAYDRYIRENYQWGTGLEGHIPSFGDMVSVTHDIPRWTNGGIIKTKAKNSAGGGLFTYAFNTRPQTAFEIGDFADYSQSLLLRKNDGSVAGPFQVAIANPNRLTTAAMAADADLDAMTVNDGINENPLFQLGPNAAISKNVVVKKLAPSDQGEVQVDAAPYDERLFAADEATAPAADETHGHLPDFDALPAVSGLRVVPAPTETVDGGVGVSASWFAMPGAQFYLVQYSYDAKVWEEVVLTKEVNVSFPVEYRYLYVRVAAVNSAQGAWAYWTGQAPIYDTDSATPPTGLVVASAGQVLIQADGTVIARALLTWTQPADELVKANGFIRIQYKLTADPDVPDSWNDWGTVQGSQTFDFVTAVRTASIYDFRIRSENKFGGFSVWAVPAAGAHTVIGDTTAPNPPSGLSVTAKPGYIEIIWTASNSPDVFEYSVYRNTSNTTVGATLIGQNSGTFFDDATAVAGTPYWYWIAPVDGSENEGTKTAAGSATAVASLSDVAPTAPTAATLTGSGTYLAGDGSVFSYLEFSVPALPANARWQNLLFRRNVSGDYMIVAQLKNTGASTIRIDDLSPGVVYQVATQSWSSSRGSALTGATSSPFTAPNDSSAPATPTGLVATVGTGKAVSLDWNDNAEGDFSEYAVWRHTADVAGSATKIAEVRASRFVDTDVTLGQIYYYWISAYDKTENQSAKTASVNATPSTVPATSADATTAPSNPSAPTLSTSSFYNSTDGTVFSRLVINVPAMPTGAVLLNILYRRNGTTGWIVADQRSAGGSTSSIDDLSPGEAYEVACQAFNVFGVASSVINATGSPFTAPSKSTAPATPSGGSLSADGVTPKTITGTTALLFGCNVGWTPNTESDLSHYEIKATGTDSDGATDYSWTIYDLVNFVAKPRFPGVVLYNSTNAAGYVRVRAVNRSGVASAWYRIGNANSASSFGVGNLATQNSTGVVVTALKIGGSGARQVLARYTETIVFTLAGGSPYEDFSVSISGRGFSAKPDVGIVQINGSSIGEEREVDAVYLFDHGSNSSSTAYLTVFRKDGANLSAGLVRVAVEFLDYA